MSSTHGNANKCDVVVVDFAAEKDKNPNPDHRQSKLNMRVRAVA